MNAAQDYYPENLAHCYGCGRLNAQGHHVRTFWEGEGTVARFRPEPHHISVPGFVYGGLIASLIDCHGTGSAAAAMYHREGREVDSMPPFRFVTGSLQVDFLKPTPLGVELELRGRIEEVKDRKVVVAIDVLAEGVVTARGRVVAVRMPEGFGT